MSCKIEEKTLLEKAEEVFSGSCGADDILDALNLIGALLLAIKDSGGMGGGSGITFAAGIPAGGDGSVGDVRVDTDTNITYEKTGVATWTARGQWAVSVDDASANFVTPTQGTLGATLA